MIRHGVHDFSFVISFRADFFDAMVYMAPHAGLQHIGVDLDILLVYFLWSLWLHCGYSSKACSIAWPQIARL